MPPSSFDPLSNPRTSQVLFLIAHGLDTPTGMAKALRVQPPAIIDQLHKLRKIRVVSLGEKTGKEQHYTLDWDGLVEASIRHIFRPYSSKTSPSGWSPDEVIDESLKSVKFRQFVRAYLEGWIPLVRPGGANPFLAILTFSDLLDQLYRTVIAMMHDDLFSWKLWQDTQMQVDQGDLSLRDMVVCLRMWNSIAEADPFASTEIFLQALAKVGFHIDLEALKRPGIRPAEVLTVHATNEGAPSEKFPPMSDSELEALVLAADRFKPPPMTQVKRLEGPSREDTIRIVLAAGLAMKDETTGKYQITEKGRQFLQDPVLQKLRKLWDLDFQKAPSDAVAQDAEAKTMSTSE